MYQRVKFSDTIFNFPLFRKHFTGLLNGMLFQPMYLKGYSDQVHLLNFQDKALLTVVHLGTEPCV